MSNIKVKEEQDFETLRKGILANNLSAQERKEYCDLVASTLTLEIKKYLKLHRLDFSENPLFFCENIIDRFLSLSNTELTKKISVITDLSYLGFTPYKADGSLHRFPPRTLVRPRTKVYKAFDFIAILVATLVKGKEELIKELTKVVVLDKHNKEIEIRLKDTEVNASTLDETDFKYIEEEAQKRAKKHLNKVRENHLNIINKIVEDVSRKMVNTILEERRKEDEKLKEIGVLKREKALLESELRETRANLEVKARKKEKEKKEDDDLNNMFKQLIG